MNEYASVVPKGILHKLYSLCRKLIKKRIELQTGVSQELGAEAGVDACSVMGRQWHSRWRRVRKEEGRGGGEEEQTK